MLDAFHADLVWPILPIGAGLIHRLQVGLVDQRRGLEGMSLPFLAYREAGDAAQFAFHQGEQFVQAAFLGIALISGLLTEALDPL